MPTYEYVCKSCGHLFEIVQSMRDASLTECPECGGVLRKVFAPPAISFKGSGFYATDHGKKGAKSSDKGDKADQADKKDAGSSEKPSSSDTSDSSEKPSSSDTSGSSEKPSSSEKAAKPAGETAKDAPKSSPPATSKESRGS